MYMCVHQLGLSRKTLIKLLNLTNSVYNFSKNGSETAKTGIRYLLRRWSMLASNHVVKQVVWGKGIKAFSHVSGWVCKPYWDMST